MPAPLTDAQAALCTEFDPNAIGVAAQYGPRVFAAGIELDDLVQVARLGLIEAARRWDPARGLRFWTFAQRRVHGAILDMLRASAVIGRHRTRNGGPSAGHTVFQWSVLERDPETPFDLEGPAPDLPRAVLFQQVVARVRTLEPRARRVVARWTLGETEAEIGPRLGISQSRVSQVKKAALAEVRAAVRA